MTDRTPRRWVLLHGFTGSPAAWDEIRATLGARGEVLCPALAGHAADAGQASDFEGEVDRLARVVTAAGFEGSHLCGYSLGARLALGLLVRHPGLFSRATLIGVNPGLPEAGDERTQRAAGDERWAQLAERSTAEFLAQWGAQPLFATQRSAAPPALAAQAQTRAGHDGAALAGAMRALSLARMPDWRPLLPRLAMPVHLIAGELDTRFVEIARQTAPSIPNATLTIVPGAGHNVVLERPSAVVCALTSDGASDDPVAAGRRDHSGAGQVRPRSLVVLRAGGVVRGLAGAAAGQVRREGLLVRVVDGNGVAGQGEASPLPGYSPDTFEQCARQLEAVDVGALPAPADAPAADWIERALVACGVSAPAARFGLETALLDWLGQRRGESVAVMLGGVDAAARRVPLSALVTDLASARAAHARGVRAFKLKISPATFEEDLRLARALREEFGESVALRFDANGRLSPDAVDAQLRALAAFAPEFVEEPVPPASLLRLESSPVPLAADESLALAGTWPAAARICRVLVLKPTVLGGLVACLGLARDATARGLAATVTHTFDGPVALAAAAELAAALPGETLACGLDSHGGLLAWPPMAIPQLRADHVRSAGRPGLGLLAVPTAAGEVPSR